MYLFLRPPPEVIAHLLMLPDTSLLQQFNLYTQLQPISSNMNGGSTLVAEFHLSKEQENIEYHSSHIDYCTCSTDQFSYFVIEQVWAKSLALCQHCFLARLSTRDSHISIHSNLVLV